MSSGGDGSKARAEAPRRIRVRDLGRGVPYGRALEAQRRVAREKIEGREPDDWLLLLEHQPVVTLGRGARDGRHLTAAPELLATRGIETVEIERGGDVTYHGPGQLVGYPILDLSRWRKDLHWYVRTLEEALIRALGGLGLGAFRAEGYTGVWVGAEDSGDGKAADLPADEAEGRIRRGEARKIASIGVHVSRWVTWHGFALNVTDEPLESFRLIVPCGIPDVRMTSVVCEGAPASRPKVLDAVRRGFARAFGAEVASAGADVAVSGEERPVTASKPSRGKEKAAPERPFPLRSAAS